LGESLPQNSLNWDLGHVNDEAGRRTHNRGCGQHIDKNLKRVARASVSASLYTSGCGAWREAVGFKTFSRVPAPTPSGCRDTFLRGTIYTPGNAHIPCAVRDLWPTGARLLVPSSSKLPAHFRLVVDAAGIRANCTLFMRSEDAVEVSFAYPPA